MTVAAFRKPRHTIKLACFTEQDRATPAGVVGLGLMGTSITACLLASGHRVTGVDKESSRRRRFRKEGASFLREMRSEGLLTRSPTQLLERLQVSADFSALQNCGIVIEAVREDLTTKREVLRRIEGAVPSQTLIGSNTSALPITELQSGTSAPERILGTHWAEPAHITRFMEVICGDYSSLENAQRIINMARRWGKEPTLVRKDVRGFITNRIMYAMIREAFHLVEGGYATPADVDRSVRNDLGYWITFAGPFRFMDLTGIPAYAAVMRDLLPDLDCSKDVPALMRKVVDAGCKGVSTSSGFYQYTPRQAKRWQELFLKFSYEIRQLALKYPEDVGDRSQKTRRRSTT